MILAQLLYGVSLELRILSIFVDLRLVLDDRVPRRADLIDLAAEIVVRERR